VTRLPKGLPTAPRIGSIVFAAQVPGPDLHSCARLCYLCYNPRLRIFFRLPAPKNKVA
jgi:hypothetical protein